MSIDRHRLICARLCSSRRLRSSRWNRTYGATMADIAPPTMAEQKDTIATRIVWFKFHLGFILRSPGFLASDLGILHQICPEFELIHIVRPLLHQLPPFFQQIAAPVGRLDLIADGVRQRHLNDL